jgi:hypothetical protein
VNALRFLVLLGLFCVGQCVARAQSDEGVMSDAEVETLREASYIPSAKLAAYEKILETRAQKMQDLISKPRHVGFGNDMHDLMQQFGAIAQELNDNLDEWDKQHRDLRKPLPKLVHDVERWQTTLSAPPNEPAFAVVRKLALDAANDLKTDAVEMQTLQETYFKEHPEAAKREKERQKNPGAAMPDEGPR